MAELSTIARPYAEALYRVAQAGDLDRWSELVDTMAEAAANPTMRSVMSDPKLAPEDIYGVFAGVLGTALEPEAENFVRTLIDNDRLVVLPEIALQFHALKNAGEGTAPAAIHSAFPMSAEAVAQLIGALERKFGIKLVPTVSVDETLIGGVRVVVNDEVLDASVKTKLEEMRVALSH